MELTELTEQMELMELTTQMAQAAVLVEGDLCQTSMKTTFPLR